MAQRRMFSLQIVDTDKFLDMPSSAQALYFHLGMRADDEGFVSSPRKITKLAGSAADDLNLLVAKNFIIPFETGICVITNWKQNNYIQKDRFAKTIHIEEKALLKENSAGVYQMDTKCIQDGYTGKDRLGKDSIGNKEKEIGADAPPPKDSKFKKPTVQEIKAYCVERKNSIDSEQFFDFYETKGWKVGNQAMKDWKACVRTWERRDNQARASGKKDFPQHDPVDLNSEDDEAMKRLEGMT